MEWLFVLQYTYVWSFELKICSFLVYVIIYVIYMFKSYFKYFPRPSLHVQNCILMLQIFLWLILKILLYIKDKITKIYDPSYVENFFYTFNIKYNKVFITSIYNVIFLIKIIYFSLAVLYAVHLSFFLLISISR